MNALFPLYANPWEGFSNGPPPQITQTLNRHENSIPKHIWFHFQNRLCVSYNVVTVPIIKSDPGIFLSISGTWPNPQNWEFFAKFYTNWGKTHTIYYNQIKQKLANKNISTLWFLQVLFIGVHCHKIVTIFCFLNWEYSPWYWKNILFCNWEHDPKLVFKMCQKTLFSLSEISRKQLHLYHYTYSRQIYIARQRIFWSKLMPDSLNRMNTHALNSYCLPDPNKYKSYMIQISY